MRCSSIVSRNSSMPVSRKRSIGPACTSTSAGPRQRSNAWRKSAAVASMALLSSASRPKLPSRRASCRSSFPC